LEEREKGTENCSNLLALSARTRVYWGKALFALKIDRRHRCRDSDHIDMELVGDGDERITDDGWLQQSYNVTPIDQLLQSILLRQLKHPVLQESNFSNSRVFHILPLEQDKNGDSSAKVRHLWSGLPFWAHLNILHGLSFPNDAEPYLQPAPKQYIYRKTISRDFHPAIEFWWHQERLRPMVSQCSFEYPTASVPCSPPGTTESSLRQQLMHCNMVNAGLALGLSATKSQLQVSRSCPLAEPRGVESTRTSTHIYRSLQSCMMQLQFNTWAVYNSYTTHDRDSLCIATWTYDILLYRQLFWLISYSFL